MPDTDIFNIPNASYPHKIFLLISVSEEDISSFIKTLHPFKRAGSDGIPFFVLKCFGNPLVLLLKPVIQACNDFAYHSTAFYHSNTVSLKKPCKGDYSVPGACRPIMLFN
jgi:hypothetical protein